MNISKPWEPINIEAEQGLLGALLWNNDAHAQVSGLIEPHHFSDPFHGHLYEIITSLVTHGKLANPITVQAFLPPTIEGLNIPTKKYVAQLAAEATTIVNSLDYAKHIREMADRRQIGEIARLMMPDAATDAVHLASEAIEQLDGIVTSHSTSGAPALDMRQAMVRAVDATAHAYQNDGKIIGIPFTLRDLDQKTGGMSRGDLVVLGGRPGMGKSAMALTMLRREAEKGYRSMLVSLEMSDVPMSHRMMSDAIFDRSCDHIPYNFLRSGRFHENLFEVIRTVAEQLAVLPIKIEQQPGLTVSQIAARARQMKRKGGLDILCIDHLDLIRASGRYAGNKVYELGEITAALKALAKELDVVVVLLCQLSRQVESREDKRPLLSDLRSSGSIEQDADTVILLFREEYYLATNEPRIATPEYEMWENKSAAAKNKLIAIICKQRMGPTGPVELFCDIANNAIRDASNDYGPGVR